MRQIITQNTCNGKVLDVLLTTVPELYAPPVIVPPVPADDPNKGVPSDHSTAVATPLACSEVGQSSNEYTVRTFRPLPESGITLFGQWVTSETWDNVCSKSSPDKQVEALQATLSEQLDKIFPLKKVKVSTNDKSYITAELKKLDRLKKREYRKHGKSVKWVKLQKKFDLKLKKAAADHLDKNCHALKQSDPGKAYSILKRMGAQPGDMLGDGSFSLLSHLEANLTKKESVE